MRILFVCKANRFRSKVAEAIFNSYLERKKVSGFEVKSAGERIDILRPYVAKVVMNILKERGVGVRDEGSRKIDDNLIEWADKIVVAANNVNLDIFPNEKMEVWNIEDADESEVDRVRMIIDKIDDKVKEFLVTLKV